MKPLNRSVFLLGASLVASSAMALDTADVQVNATVVGACKFNTGGTVDFTLDPSSALDVTGTVSTKPQFWCTKGTLFTLSDNVTTAGGTFQMTHSADPTEVIPYTFSYTPTSITGNGPSTPIDINIDATVTYADYKDAAEGNYSQVVTLEITP